MSTAQTKPSTRKASNSEAKLPLDTTVERVRTTTTKERLEPIEREKPAEPEPKVVVLTPHEALIEQLRAQGSAHNYTISVYRLANYDNDQRTNSTADGRKFLKTIRWDVENWETDIQNNWGEGAYFVEVKKDRKLIGVNFVFECDDPLDGPPRIAANQYEQMAAPGQPYPVMDTMQQMDAAFKMIDRVCEMIFDRMPKAPNPAPAPALPQVINPPALAPSPLEALIKAATSDDPVTQKVVRLLFGGGESSDNGESATNMYDVLKVAADRVPWEAVALHLAQSLGKTEAPSGPGQSRQPPQQAIPPAQPQESQNPAPEASEQKVEEQNSGLNFNQVAQVLLNDMVHNAPVEQTASLVAQLGKEQPQAGAEVAMMLNLPAEKVWQAIVGIFPTMQQWEALPHRLTWIENLQAKLKPAEEVKNDGT
jgi:hypothetical protein